MMGLTDLFANLHQGLFEALVQPLMFEVGLGHLLADGFEATRWFLVGLLQLVVLVAILGPMQRWRPVEAVMDRAAIGVDVLYTLIHRLGLFRLVLFFAISPLTDEWLAWLQMHGIGGIQFDQWLGVDEWPWVSLFVYLLVFDAFDYAYHRAEHHWDRWWALHAVHHSQRQMTMWTDNRNHLLDDLIRDVMLVMLARFVGVAPTQFVAVVAITQLLESLSHANLSWSFGRWGDRLLVSPRYHRTHHAIGLGHESLGEGSMGGHNFAVLFPVWDILFGTARFETLDHPTGIRDQLQEHGGRDYGRGFWSQQLLGLKRMLQPSGPIQRDADGDGR